jgi:hypothetical protein
MSHRLHTLRFLKYLPQLAFSLLTLYGTFRALGRGNRKALLFAAVLLLYPLVYYITHTFGGFFYQYPIQPEMLALAMAAVVTRTSPSAVNSQPLARSLPLFPW